MKNSGRAAAALVLTLLVAAVPAVAAAVAAPDWGTKSTILKNVHAYAFASGLRFYEVLVGHQLQISPAPASPTFGDSPDDAYLLSRDRSLRGVRDIRRMLQWKLLSESDGDSRRDGRIFRPGARSAFPVLGTPRKERSPEAC